VLEAQETARQQARADQDEARQRARADEEARRRAKVEEAAHQRAEAAALERAEAKQRLVERGMSVADRELRADPDWTPGSGTTFANGCRACSRKS